MATPLWRRAVVGTVAALCVIMHSPATCVRPPIVDERGRIL